MQLKLNRFTSSQLELLKYTAIVLMTIDHIGAIFFNAYDEVGITMLLGRMVFPMFAFLAAYNYLFNTSDKWKYISRLLLFAAISQVPYMLAFEGIHHRFILNVLFTLGLSLGYLYIGETYLSKFKKKIDMVLGNILLTLIFLIFFMYLGDFGFFGFLVIVRVYMLLKNPTMISLVFLVLFLGLMNMNDGWPAIIFTVLSVPVIYAFSFLNVEVKRVFKGLWFYVYYPLHLMVLALLGMYCI